MCVVHSHKAPQHDYSSGTVKDSCSILMLRKANTCCGGVTQQSVRIARLGVEGTVEQALG